MLTELPPKLNIFETDFHFIERVLRKKPEFAQLCMNYCLEGIKYREHILASLDFKTC